MIPQITPREVAKLRANDHVLHLVDVREPWEHDTAAIADSVLLPLAELVGRVDDLEVAKDETVVVYCHHGIRSLSGAQILMQAGFRKVYSLAGGIDAWSSEVDPMVPRY